MLKILPALLRQIIESLHRGKNQDTRIAEPTEGAQLCKSYTCPRSTPKSSDRRKSMLTTAA